MAAPPTRIQQISLPDLTINYNFKDVPRYDRCTTCHQGIDRLGYDKDAEGKPMPSVYAAHPHLTDGATAVDPTGKVVTAGLYLDGNGPHTINSFGCTICHGGQGSGTDFTYASHEPNDLEEKEHWEQKYHWHEIHHWDEPMLPTRFLQSSCIKCHHQVTDVPQADKLQAGYQRIVKYGCTGCHTIGGEGSFGPDLTDERQVGPNLGHLGSKVSRDWALKWIKNPHAFRPDTRMPRYYGLTNNDAKGDWPKNHAEIHAITHYLFSKSTPPAEFVDPPAKGDAGAGQGALPPEGLHGLPRPQGIRTGDLPRVRPRIRQGRLRPQPLEHRGQVPVAGAGLPLAGQLDQGPRGVPPQEPDAQRPALVPGLGRHRLLDPLDPGRVARAGRPSRPSTPPRSRKGSTSWSSSTSPRGASPWGASRSRSCSARSTAS